MWGVIGDGCLVLLYFFSIFSCDLISWHLSRNSSIQTRFHPHLAAIEWLSETQIITAIAQLKMHGH